MDTDTTTARIRALNDAVRCSLSDGKIYVTSGIASLLPKEQAAILDRVRTFDDFTPDNDPHGEHDFGSFEHRRKTIFWKIDYYDLLLCNGSRDPSDPALTRRVLTVMLAEEY
jgi:hypothetical protein